MALRINTNIAAYIAHRNLNMSDSSLARSQERLSSGKRINRAGDDAAGLAIANRFGGDIRAMKVASRNVSEATSLMQVAEGAVSSIESILVRMKELATQAASDTASTQRTTLNSEFAALKEEIERIADSTNYQGATLLQGTFSGTVQIGSGNTTNDRLTIALGNMQTAALGDGLNFISAADISTLTGAQTAITTVDAALGQVRGELGGIGAKQNRLDYASSNLSTSILNYQNSESIIRDVDMAAESIEFTRNQILQQAGIAMLAQANQSPQSVLGLLQ